MSLTTRRRRRAQGWEDRRILAVGHSTRSLEEMVGLLWAHGVAVLADIRTVPRSRTNPQFNPDVFAPALLKAGLRHLHLAELGGLRKRWPDSPNGAWRNRSFQGYADHMQTDTFLRGLERLREVSVEGPTAIMCAEALRWRCHRSLVADALFARGVVVEHLESETRARPHVPTAFARIRGLRVTYPPEPVAAGERA